MTVSPVYVLDLAAQHAQWAAVRQAVVTGNIANANTRGYTAREIEPFSAVLADTSTEMAMACTEPGHIDASGETSDGAPRTFDVKDTGNAVKLDSQLMEADATSRAFSLDTSIERAFHRMLMTAVRST